jgi:tripartite-type tricarboxylate transporter receptor subunit TctC
LSDLALLLIIAPTNLLEPEESDMRIASCALAIGVAFSMGLAEPARSETACAQPVKVIVAYPPGAPDDLIARLLTQKLAEKGGRYIVENMPGASGIIGNTAAAKAAPDGCTLLVVNQNFVVQPAVNAKFSYDVPGSFAPVAFLAAAPETISVNPSVPAKTMQELVVLLKANPGKYSYASPGHASSPHIAAERLFRLTYGLDVTHVPFQGGPPAVTSTIGGHTAIVHLTLPVVAPSVKDGKLRMLAVADRKRHPEFPDVPTLAESGIPNHEVGFWNALLAPRGTPADILDDLNRQVAQVMAQPEVREKLAVIGFTPVTGSRSALAEHIDAELALWKSIVTQAKIKID